MPVRLLDATSVATFRLCGYTGPPGSIERMSEASNATAGASKSRLTASPMLPRHRRLYCQPKCFDPSGAMISTGAFGRSGLSRRRGQGG
jgi:hypothetical protein